MLQPQRAFPRLTQLPKLPHSLDMPASETPPTASAPPLQCPRQGLDADGILEHFLVYASGKGLTLYPAQEEAILELLGGANVILKTPTGSGKSLVAAALHFKSLCEGRRSVYTCPIKALVNEKFLSLCKDFGPENVGMSTGDATVNPKAPILCCTAEVLSNIALREGAQARFQDVIMDEFHYYGDRERGSAWQIPLLTMSQARFLLISATLGDTTFFERSLTRLTGAPTVSVWTSERPVPLHFSYTENGLESLVQTLQEEGKLPAYLVHFTQRAATESAHNLLSINLLNGKEKDAVNRSIKDTRFNSPFGKDVRKLLSHGIGLHHAGMLPKYRILVEQLAQKNLLRLICGTDTLGVGVNVPIRTVVFTSLAKYDGEKARILPVRDFHQIAGRAGRRGFDENGYVLAQAPEHVIENKKLERKARENPKKGKSFRKSTPPKGTIVWDENTFQTLINGDPEPLLSSFAVTHGMLINVLSRPADGCPAMRQLIRDCHDTPVAKARHRKHAFQLFRALVEKEIVEILPREDKPKSTVRVNVDLQEDFSLNQTLSLFLVDTVTRMDMEAEEYAVLVLALAEAILENPDAILRQQIRKEKDRLMAEMKAEGVPYEERLERLVDITHPKPYGDWIYSIFNEFAAQHPWIGTSNIRPKSIGLEMYERLMRFDDYVKDYSLERAEGLLLRHLSNLYKVLAQTVPESAWNDDLEEVILYFGELVRATDSSLLDEWERLRDPSFVAAAEIAPDPAARLRPHDLTRDRKALERLCRAAIFTFIRGLATRQFLAAAETLAELAGRPSEDAGPPPVVRADPPECLNEGRGVFAWNVQKLATAFAPYAETHSGPRLDPPARAAINTRFESEPDHPQFLLITHTLVDSSDLNDWALLFRLDLQATRASGRPVMHLVGFLDEDGLRREED